MSKKILSRNQMPSQDCWDLNKLFANAEAWEKGLEELQELKNKITSFKGTLGENPENLYQCFVFNNQIGVLEERLGYYAHLRTAEDGSNSEHQGRMSRFMQVATEIGALFSFQAPEIQAIDEDKLKTWMQSDLLKPWSFNVEKLLRQKSHILSESEERILAMQSQAMETPDKAFGSLTNVDLDFGEIEGQALSQSSYSVFMENQNRDIRKKAYLQFMQGFDNHKHTLSNLYEGSVQQDVFYAKVRNYKSARQASLFKDDVPELVYDNLIETVHDNLPALHKYYDVRRKALGVEKLHLYDTRVPLVKELKQTHTYDEAVNLVLSSLKPLGSDYCNTLKDGLFGGWVDKYENKGKRSGAFSAGSFVGDPYILLNYKEDVLNDVFTLAHEAGHSMHSWYSVRNNEFHQYNYTIFVAEVASTFNEQLLARYLMQHTDDIKLKTYLINKEIDDILATIYRQTMFAEFEKITHAMLENGIPLTVDSLRMEYRKLLQLYFGGDVVLEDVSDLECLRIPHFYSAFYVYKYATGLSAAIALADRVLDGGKQELDDYLSFLKSGGSDFPLNQLRSAGVDMQTAKPIDLALQRFAKLVDELEGLL